MSKRCTWGGRLLADLKESRAQTAAASTAVVAAPATIARDSGHGKGQDARLDNTYITYGGQEPNTRCAGGYGPIRGTGTGGTGVRRQKEQGWRGFGAGAGPSAIMWVRGSTKEAVQRRAPGEEQVGDGQGRRGLSEASIGLQGAPSARCRAREGRAGRQAGTGGQGDECRE